MVWMTEGSFQYLQARNKAYKCRSVDVPKSTHHHHLFAHQPVEILLRLYLSLETREKQNGHFKTKHSERIDNRSQKIP